MGKYAVNTPARDGVHALLEKFEDHVAGMEKVLGELSEYMEDYMDETEDMIAEAGCCLEEASREHQMNGMLFRELNAGRKELLSLLELLAENGIQPPEEKHIHYGRLDPGLYVQDPDSPFYIQDPDKHFTSLLSGQLAELVWFEEFTPMTTPEREALRDHVIRKTGFEPDPAGTWSRFLDGLRKGDSSARRKGW